MSKSPTTPSSPTIPFHLCQVLEEEYEQIQTKHLPKRSWLFKPGHFKKGYQSFIDRLQNSQDPLSRDLRERLPLLVNEQHREHYKRTGDLSQLGLTREEVIDFLNTLLGSDQLYDEQRFKRVALRKSMLNLIDLGGSKSSASRFRGEDLLQFNRLLLEEAYPDQFKRIHEIRLDHIYRCIRKKKNAALCLSGGGIRSGTFSLGILQGLARQGLLDRFDYLSTVSGGGYIGSWLSAWIYRNPRGMSGVIDDLKNAKPESKLQPEPSPIQYLREYSHFLTPRYSLLSADVWAFVAIYLRNLLLNWIVFIPLLICVLTLPRLFLSGIAHKGSTLWTLIFFLLGVALAAISIGYIGFNRPSMGDALYAKSRFWRPRTGQGSFLKYCLLTLTSSAILVSLAWAWTTLSGNAPLNSSWLSSISERLSFFRWPSNSVLSPFLTWLYSLRWAYLFALASYSIGVSLSLIILRRVTLLIRDLPFYTLILAPLSAIFLWVITTHVFGDPTKPEVIGLYAVFGPPLYLLVWLLSITIVVGLTSRNYSYHRYTPAVRALLPRDEDQEWYARLGGWLLIAIIVWVLLTTLVVFGPLLLVSKFWPYVMSLGGGSGIFAALAGHSSKTPATQEKASEQAASPKSLVSTVLSLVMPYILTLASLIFIMFLIAALSLVTSIILSFWLPKGATSYVEVAALAMASPLQVAVLLLVTLAFALGAARLINLSKFSLHASYRTRLIRTYLGASRSRAERKPNRFTGFDPADNIQMDELRPGLIHERDFKKLPEFVRELRMALTDPQKGSAKEFTWLVDQLGEATKSLLRNHDDTNLPSPSLKTSLITDLNSILENVYFYPPVAASSSATLPDVVMNREILDQKFSEHIKEYRHVPYRLFHVINMTLNLFHGENLAWQQRKAESFTTSALHSGSFNLGYRETKHYGGPEGLSLGTAATTSGAAVNSNMGNYFSSSLVSFVLTFFNARLGLWLGNPGIAGNSSYTLAYPNWPVQPIISEAFGYTDNRSEFVNLSDGGHFENLALYEMVLRRCNFIVVVDGGEDAECKFDDLGNAVRKIRIDLDIPIEFEHTPIYPRDHPHPEDGTYWAVGRIKYSCVDGSPAKNDGLLLYIKPAFYGSEPSDIYNYAMTHEAFPHQTTANQFFNESQFESYRMLGSYIIDQIWSSETPPESIADFAHSAFDKSKGSKTSKEFERWIINWHKNQSPGSSPYSRKIDPIWSVPDS